VYRGPGVYRGPPEVYRGPCMKNMRWNRQLLILPMKSERFTEFQNINTHQGYPLHDFYEIFRACGQFVYR